MAGGAGVDLLKLDDAECELLRLTVTHALTLERATCARKCRTMSYDKNCPPLKSGRMRAFRGKNWASSHTMRATCTAPSAAGDWGSSRRSGLESEKQSGHGHGDGHGHGRDCATAVVLRRRSSTSS